MERSGVSALFRTICVALLALASGAARAQEVQGSLLVAVEDGTGGRVAGAEITLALAKSAFARSGKADERGEARFALLPPGTYHVAVEAGGFARKTTVIAVAVSGQPTLLIRLRLQRG
jgi:hypothetical protein